MLGIHKYMRLDSAPSNVGLSMVTYALPAHELRADASSGVQARARYKRSDQQRLDSSMSIEQPLPPCTARCRRPTVAP